MHFDENNIKYNTSKSNSGGVYAYAYSDISLKSNNIIQNTSNYNGSGILVFANEEIRFNNNNISNNISVGSFSGIYISKASNLYIIRNTISLNVCQSTSSSTYRGSGLFFNSDVLNAIITDNLFKNNYSLSSATLMLFNTGSLIISKNTITQNQPNAIQSENASSITIDSNIIKGSTGTGIHITSSSENSMTCTIRNNVIMNFNNSSNEGGGVYVNNFRLIEIYQNLIANNMADKGAGLFLNPASSLFMFNNTIASNFAESQGGGLYVKTSNMLYNLSLNSNIFWANTATLEGDDIYLHGFGANPRELKNNTVREISGTFENTSNNISSDPLFFSPETGDYHLRPNSPCINAGISYTPTDLDGTLILNNRDMGAYEYNPTITHPADTNSNFIIEENEYSTYNNSWRNNLPWTKDPVNIPIEYNTRAGFIIEKGGAYINTGAMKPLCWSPDN